VIDFNNLTKQQQQYVALGGLVAAGVLYGVYMLGNMLVGADAASRIELEELTEKIERAESGLRGKSRVQQNTVAVKRDLDEMLEWMPEPGNEYIWATERVYSLIRGSGLNLRSVDNIARRGAGKGDVQIGDYAVRLSATGGYNEARQFLAKLEDAEPLVSVRNVEISESTMLALGHTLQMDLYWPVLIEGKGAEQ
jgi:hypothetical protein